MIGFGACDDNVSVSVSSSIDIPTVQFLVESIRFDEVDEACWGRSMDVHLFSGTPGEYSLEATANDFLVPRSTTFTVPHTAFGGSRVDSTVLTKLAIELRD